MKRKDIIITVDKIFDFLYHVDNGNRTKLKFNVLFSYNNIIVMIEKHYDYVLIMDKLDTSNKGILFYVMFDSGDFVDLLGEWNAFPTEYFTVGNDNSNIKYLPIHDFDIYTIALDSENKRLIVIDNTIEKIVHKFEVDYHGEKLINKN